MPKFSRQLKLADLPLPLRYLIRLALLSGLIYLLFFFFYLSPLLTSRKTLADAKLKLEVQKQILTADRMTIIEYNSLDPNHIRFVEDKAELADQLKTVNDTALKSFSGQTMKKAGGNKNVVQLIDQELMTDYPKMNERAYSLLKDQEAQISLINRLNNILKNVYIYDPADDLGKPDIIKDKEVLLERIAAADNGLSKIEENIKNTNLNLSEIDNFISGSKNIRSILNTLRTGTERGSSESAAAARRQLITDYPPLKIKAFAIEQAVIRFPKSVQILTDETNLINDYQRWIDKISEEQKKLKLP